MMICDGIIFDVDGTLWDSTNVVKSAWNKAIVDSGFDNPNITADRLKGLFGLPMDDIIKDIMPQMNKEERDNLAPMIYKYEHDFLESESGILYEDIIETMRQLAASIPVYIISNCQAGYIELFMRITGIEDIVIDHLCPADTGLLKADNIKKMINDYDIKKPLYVGDTIMDSKACKDAGCPFCFAEYGFGEVEDPEYVIKSPKELLDLIQL